ncbi:hypothetical protein CAPTEDRAFT_220152 [Capitella teleta]|uniref:RUN domain-containing protein n=1 Tax=Capitella teleta TaxID=283909 RepID=R7V6L2_CAPTE|nr:hypothetical protein CAPTEDRAFT_220152 [Capitella teleta]|eukprot:ELU14169.1 hypothetical protein CAPTEDRAFT_220152 [Capitella teleta]
MVRFYEIFLRGQFPGPLAGSQQELPPSPTKGQTTSPPGQMDRPTAPPALCSPEDALNNDFFYDDEFAVPFDCNLGEMEEREMLESLDLNRYGLAGHEDNWRNPLRMASSKSDSCLYQAELTDSERDMSTSERDCISSSEMSDFKSEPLFSPQPPVEDDDQLSCSHLAHDSLGPEDLTASLGKQFSYDWTANKDRYMLSFSPSKCSAGEDSLHEEGLMTTWAQKSSQSQTSWGSLKKGSSSNNSSTVKSSASSGMTTWAQVKQTTTPPVSETSSSDLVTWKQVKEASDEWQASDEGTSRSKSLPDLKQHVKVSSCEKSASFSNDQDKPPTPLMELFHRVRSPPSEEERSSNEAMVSPHCMQQLMGTWSVSPISLSRQSEVSASPPLSPTADTAKPNAKGLISWNTFKNLAAVQDSLQPSLPSLDQSKLIEQLNSLQSKQKTDVSIQQFVSTSVQAGSALFSKDLQEVRHTAIQFPPVVNHCGSQTSKLLGKRSCSLQISPNSHPHRTKCSALRPSRSEAFSVDGAESVQLSDAAKQRMSASAFLANGPLPDLSFLKQAPVNPSHKNHRMKITEEQARVPNSVPKPKRSFSCEPAAMATKAAPLRRHRHEACRRARSTDSGSSSFSSCTSSSGIGSSESCCPHQRQAQLQEELCCCCQRKQPMAHSHPLRANRRLGQCPSSLRDVNYLLVSPVHDPHQMCPTCLQYQPYSSHTHRNGRPPPLQRHRPFSQPASSFCRHQPLKSCLAKKALMKKGLALKHRSWSDPSDAMVLKHSHDGQIIYQLVTPAHPTAAACDYRAQQLQQTPDSLERSSEGSCNCLKSSGSSSSCEQQRPSPIPVPACSCGTTHAVLHSSEEMNPEMYKTKKSVSFSEQISYHSPGTSPRVSPCMGPRAEPLMRLHHEAMKRRPLSFPGALDSVSMRKRMDQNEAIPEDPPSHFYTTPDSLTLSDKDASHKRGLVMAVIQGADTILDYFSQVDNQNQQVALGDTSQNEEVGHLVLQHLGPALQAFFMDGLQPQVSSLLGKVRNNVWRFVLDSAQMGSSNRVLCNLIQELKSLKGLDSIWLKFNAFVFGLLNHRALDFWLTSVHHNERLLSRHYAPDALVCCLSSTEGRPLLMELTTALQPLAHLPWHLDYRLEVSMVQERRQAQMLNDMQGSRQSQVLQATGRHLYRRVQEHLTPSNSSARRPIPMLMRSSAASDISDASSGPPSIFHGSPTVSDTGSSCSGPPSVFQASPYSSSVETSAHDAHHIMRDNKMLDSAMEKSDASSAVSLDGLLQKMSRQIKELATPERPAYKSQEYRFEPDGEEERSQPQSPVEALAQRKDIFDANGVPKDSVATGVEFHIPRRMTPRSKSESVNLHQTTSLSSSSSLRSSGSASSLIARGSSALKKRWSSFGPTLISVFDRLLLDDSSKTDKESGTAQPCLAPPEQQEETTQGISRALSMDTGLKRAADTAELLNDEAKESSSDNKYVKTLCHYVACEQTQLSFDKVLWISYLNFCFSSLNLSGISIP